MPAVAMKRKTYDYDSSTEDGSPTSLDGADYTDQGWTSRAGSDWRSFTWAFGLGPSSSSSTSVVGRRRRGGRRGTTATTAKGKTAGTPRAASGGEEADPMKELLEIVLWNSGDEEIDITADLEADDAAADYDSDDEEIACFKRLAAIDREQTIRPRGVPAANAVSRMKSGGRPKKEEGGGAKTSTSSLLSVSSLRFDSILRLDTTTTVKTTSASKGDGGEKSSIARLEQRTTTMERAFKGVLDDAYTSPSTSSAKSSTMTSSASSKVTSVTAAAGDEENFWDDVEF